MMLTPAMPAWGAAPGTLTTLAAVKELDNAQASHAIPVDFEATVVYSRGYENVLFVGDKSDAIFVRPPSHVTFSQGDRMRIQGKTQNSFRPIVVAEKITVLGHGERPKPVPASFEDLIKAQFDCHMVATRGRVRSADVNVIPGGTARSARLQLVTDGGHLEVDVDSADEAALKALLDADVEVTGAAAGKFDDKMQQTGVVVYAAHLEDVRVLKRAAAAPSALPVTPMDRILAGYRVSDQSPRVRVHGTITYYQPGVAVVLQNGPRSLWIATRMRENLTIGNQADASGFPNEHDRLLTLEDGEIEDNHVPGHVQPLPATWEQLAFWSSNSPIGHQNDLVSTEGRVVTQVREGSHDEYVLDSGGRLFSAIYHHGGSNPPSAMVEIPTGTTVRVTGICTIADRNLITPGSDVPFQILLRTPEDVVMVARPPLLGIRNLTILAGILLLVTIVAVLRGWTLERKVHRQSFRIAQLEQRRSEILESINHARPLAETLEQITELVSFSLRGAPCWIEVADGARLGQFPAETAGLQIVSKEIAGHLGTMLGNIHAACDAAAMVRVKKYQAQVMGAKLAVLAIETHRLYADLRYRSEFDALTDVHNRFSLDRCLDEQIEKARDGALIFGLVYVDLDRFKLVNDLHGHHAGDIYLQVTASRMRRQLRPGDLLARLGGDEFAILVPNVRNRADAQEIARRLDGCFEAPILLDGQELCGSASVGIALYPEDGATSDDLLKAADAAMYAAKKNKSVADSAEVP
jgi:diguanylate cyclase (GGDEF)-like protein